MNRYYEKLDALLTLDRFPFRVAMFPSQVQELGAVVEVQAFDVPEVDILTVSRRLNRLLASARLVPMAIGTTFLASESAERARMLPAVATWWSPDVAPAAELWQAARWELGRSLPMSPRWQLVVMKPVADPSVGNPWKAAALLRQIAGKHPGAEGCSWRSRFAAEVPGEVSRNHYSLGA